MLAGIDYEEVRRKSRHVFGLQKHGSLTRIRKQFGKLKPASDEFEEIKTKERKIQRFYGLSFRQIHTDMNSVPIGIGQIRVVKYTARKKYSHALAFEKRVDGSVTFYDPSLPEPVTMEQWVKASPAWDIVAIMPLSPRP